MRRVVTIDDRTPEGERYFWHWGRKIGLASACGVALAHASVATAAAGSHTSEPVELAWVRLEGAEVCPPRGAFVSALEKRVKSSEFVAKAERVLTVTLSNEKGPFRAVLSLKSSGSEALESKQELFSYSSSCDELFAATVLSVALLLNPDEFGSSKSDEASIEEQDNGFFDAPADQPLGAPSEPIPTEARTVLPQPEYKIPVAPRPWARRHVFIGAAALAAIEQLPTAGPGFAARIEVPLDRAWLLWLEGDWLQAQTVPSRRSGGLEGVNVTQDAGWLGATWLPYNNEAFEFQLSSGVGFRRLQFTVTGDEPRFHLAIQLGIGTAFFLLPNFALQAQAAAVIPFEQESLGQNQAIVSPPEWTQPRVGGQLQFGFMIGIPAPPL